MAREGVEAFRDLELADAEPVPEAQLQHFEYSTRRPGNT